ncbi:hypothetical protein CFC21_014512 [Triticum aestivum]|uniref:Disease resistance N-terminal domain-containing protein n=2 Tax=Triticum aestivum TaxID=4565 RepID=A0A3B6APM7_WHEAT|nr:putative disease resistance RPP13-like protein 1 [Triticum aestivum]XP_044452325.1 putative disease resistance RPP13-like protein 1 [Triticum aestivum]KAF6998390.1 hypothetical protein CFC21_014512 [Triticum aestivum]
METAISAVASELVSQFVSLLMNKYYSLSHAQSEEKVMQRLHHLLMRAGTILEEADTRYITNSGMMMHLKTLSEAMYRGHRVLDCLRYHALQHSAGFDKVSISDSSSSSLHLAIPFKRSRTTSGKDDKEMRLESHGALKSLEIAIANMAEFIVLLGGCQRISRRPYDVYLYTDNFMFGRHTEKQKLLSFLLEHNNPPGDHALSVLPIIGGAGVGKKTLVAHVCGDQRVRSRFSSILHLNGHNLLTIFDHGRTMFGTMLVVIEFASDVGEDEWKRFHSFLIRMSTGSKIIIISKLKRLTRFGSVQPIFLNVLSYDELRYLFKTLAFGSVDPTEHPRLVQLADEFCNMLHNVPAGTLIATNMLTDVLRMNLSVQFWHCILEKGLRYFKRNYSTCGGRLSMLTDQAHLVDITDYALQPLSMIACTPNVSIKKELPSLTFGELIRDPSVIPKQDFILIAWESRIPPHNSFPHLVTSHAQGTHEGGALTGRKRRGAPI